jgi:hypothetical protein
MCRTFIKLDEDDLDYSEKLWSFVDMQEIEDEEYLEGLDEIFVGAFENLIKNRL